MSFSTPSKQVFDYVRYSADLPRELLCNVCYNPIVDAQIATPCGHTFCGCCVKRFIQEANDQTKCELCRQPVLSFCKNHFALNVLSTKQGECSACSETFPLDSALRHVESCTSTDITCNLCRETLRRVDQGTHVQVCPMVEINCECGEKLKRRQQATHKDSTCILREVSCPLKCGEMVKSYLIPSHTMTCDAVMTICQVNGCGQALRRGQVQEHIATGQMRHFSLLEKDRANLLWEFMEKPSLNIKNKGTGVIAVLKWSLPTTLPSQFICSPLFEKWGRRWRLFAKDGSLALKYAQGVESICLDVSFIMETTNGKQSIHIVRAAKLAEGETARNKPTPTNQPASNTDQNGNTRANAGYINK